MGWDIGCPRDAVSGLRHEVKSGLGVELGRAGFFGECFWLLGWEVL